MLVNRFEPIEIVIPNNTTLTKFYFGNFPNLTNAQVDRICLYNPVASNVSVLTGGQPPTYTDILQTSITLYQGDLQLYYNLPLSTLVNTTDFNDGGIVSLGNFYPVPIDIDGMEISWTKSYISTPISMDLTNVVFSFGVFYHF
jgi:hypothetical protein